MEYKDILSKLNQVHKKAVSGLANYHGVTNQAVYNSLHGQGSRRIRVHIAVMLGLTPNQIWDYESENTLILDTVNYEKLKPVLVGVVL